MFAMRIAAVTTLMLGLTACATGPVKPAYVSPTQYQALSCGQLQSEYNRIGEYIQRGVNAPTRTGVGVGFGLGGGWSNYGGWGIGPTVSVNMGQSQNTKRSEMAQLLGQQDAIAQAAQFKGCPIIKPAAPTQATTK